MGDLVVALGEDFFDVLANLQLIVDDQNFLSFSHETLLAIRLFRVGFEMILRIDQVASQIVGYSLSIWRAIAADLS